MTGGDVHVGLGRLLAPGRGGAVRGRGAVLGAVAELGGDAADTGRVGAPPTSGASGAHYASSSHAVLAAQRGFGRHVLPTQLLLIFSLGLLLTSTISSRCRYIPHTSHLVIKVCFGPSLWPQTQLAIGHLLIVVPETSDSHGQQQHSSHGCHGNKGDDGPAGALGNLDNLRETPCVRPLRRGEKNLDVS